MNIEELRLTELEISDAITVAWMETNPNFPAHESIRDATKVDKAIADAQLAKVLWGVVDLLQDRKSFPGYATPFSCGAILQGYLEATHIKRPEES
jgi:hypothetical protein